jgi:DUF2993 family protein
VARGAGPGRQWAGVVGFLAVATAIGVLASALAAAELRAALRRVLAASSVQVSLVAWPPPAVWWGRVDVLTVAARSVHVGAVEVDMFEATFDRVRFDAAALYTGRGLVIKALGSGVAHATISQGALARALSAQPSLRDVSVDLEPDRVALAATVSVLGAPLRASGEGRLALAGGTEVHLLIDRLTVAGVGVPASLADLVTQSVNPVLDARSLPFALHFTGLTVEAGRVIVDAAAGPD